MNDDAHFHVLMIEDDRKLAEGVREYLEKHGMIVVREGRGDMGLEFAVRGGFDLVLLDLMLPGLDGWRSADGCATCPMSR